MIEFSATFSGLPEKCCPWLVCETGDRWLMAVRRFAPQMMPPSLIPAVVAADPAEVLGILSGLCGLPGLKQASSGRAKAVVLREVERESLAIACDYLAQTTAASPQVLQLVAGWELTDSERMVLSELGGAMTLGHPEDLPRLARLIHGYFATSGQFLD